MMVQTKYILSSRTTICKKNDIKTMQINEILKRRSVLLFVILAGFFVANTIVAEFVGSKIFSLEKLFGFAPLSMT